MADYSYIGSGKIYLRVKDSAAGLIEVGNASALNIGVSEEEKTLKDYTQPGGGIYNSISRVSEVNVSMTLHDLNPSNVARALYGSATAITAGTVTDEHQVAYKGALVPTEHIATSITTVAAHTGNTTYQEGTDYEVVAGGILILSSGAIADGATVKITYVKAGYDAIEALTTTPQEYELVFAGLNEARSGKQTRVTIHRAKLGAAQNFSLIGEEYAALEISGKLLKDTTKTGSLSQYFTAQIAQ